MEHGARRAFPVAIDRVAQQRHAQPGLAVNADLVRPPRLGPEFEQCTAIDLMQHAPMRDRGLALPRRDHPPALFGTADLGQRQFDRPFAVCRYPGQHAEIAFLDHAILEAFRKPLERLGVARKQQAAAGVGVDPVYRDGRALEAELERFEMVFEAAAAAARARYIAASASARHWATVCPGKMGATPHDRLSVRTSDPVATGVRATAADSAESKVPIRRCAPLRSPAEQRASKNLPDGLRVTPM